MIAIRKLATLVGTALAAASLTAAAAGITTYTAVYEVRYKGRDVGASNFSVARADAPGRYTFTSSTRVKGFLRLISPNPAVDHSEFEVAGEAIRPLAFRHQDGSRRGEDNFDIGFDWAAGRAELETEDGSSAVALRPGTLDRGSLQVGIMRAMAAGAEIGPYAVIDDDGIETYAYVEEAPEQVETGLGPVTARKLIQRREGSSRTTVLFLAPALEFVPVRIEQHRNGEIETVFTLDSIELEAQD